MATKARKAKEQLLKVSARGVLTLPAPLRKGADLFAATRRSDGVIELRPQLTIDQSQAWFWSDRWQKMEFEAEEDIKGGRVHRFDDGAALVAALQSRSKSD